MFIIPGGCEVNIEAIGEDVKACNNAMTTLVQIFSIPGQDSNSTMKDATDKESGLKKKLDWKICCSKSFFPMGIDFS